MGAELAPPPKLSEHRPTYTIACVWNISASGMLWRFEST